MHSHEVAARRDLPASIAERIAREGWCVLGGFLGDETVETLAAEARSGWSQGLHRPAGTGRSNGFSVRPEIRGDLIRWLEPRSATPAQRQYLSAMESLRLVLNRELYAGLLSLEAHLAVYPPGTFYRRHLDRFSDADERVISSVFYLNPEWREEFGGQLRIYTDSRDPSRFSDVMPEAGTIVVFRSDTFYHEVLPATRERFSITGWFRRASSRLLSSP